MREGKMEKNSRSVRNGLCALAVIAACLFVFAGIAAAQGRQVISADYGIGNRRVDVTSRLQSMTQNGSLHFRVTNDTLGGDPAPNQAKELRMRVEERGGQTRDYLYQEGDTVSLEFEGGERYPNRNSDGNLRIIRARYGAGNRWMDVTGALQNLVNNDRLNAKVNDTNMGGNPAEGQRKELEFEWEFQGRRQEARLREGDYINIPESSARNSELRIIRARYGAGNRWMDVTGRLQNLVNNDRLNAKVNDRNMGGNPAGHQHKQLEVEWEFQGRRQETRLREGDYINIPDNRGSYSDLHIIRARYGAGNRWMDATGALQNLVRNNRLNVKVNDTNMGGNPAGHQRKQLEVEWEFQGRRHESRLREGDHINIP
jgi:hypothetical protein